MNSLKNIGFLILGIAGMVQYTLSQNSIYLVTTNQAGTSTISVISNGGSFTTTTTPSTQVSSKFRFYNISSNTYTYNVLRTIKTLHAQGSNTASTFFCVGATCLPPSANTLTNPADYIVLSSGSFDQLIVYLDEISTVGYSEVYYKIFNVNNPDDTLSFTMYYNPTLGITENAPLIDNIHIYPIPAQNNISIYAKVNSTLDLNISITNILGQKLFQQNIHAIENTFKKNINISSFPTGIYILNIEDASSHRHLYTKKLIITE